MQRFGEKLRALRLQHGLTLRELAVVLGYRNFGYLALLESGKKEPTLAFVMKVAEYFHVTTDALVWDHLLLDSDSAHTAPPDADDLL